MRFGVVERFAVDPVSAFGFGKCFGVSAHFAPHEEGDLFQLRFSVRRPVQARVAAERADPSAVLRYGCEGRSRPGRFGVRRSGQGGFDAHPRTQSRGGTCR